MLMNITITQQKNVPLLSRVDVEADLTYSGPTPDRNKIKKDLASKLGCKESLIVIRKIESIKYGFSQSRIQAFQYMDEKVMAKTGIAYLNKRGPEVKQSQEKPADTKKDQPKEQSEKSEQKAPEQSESNEKSESSQAGQEKKEDGPNPEDKKNADTSQEEEKPKEGKSE